MATVHVSISPVKMVCFWYLSVTDLIYLSVTLYWNLIECTTLHTGVAACPSICPSCASDCLETGKPYKDLIQWRHEADKVTSGLSGASLRSKSQRSKLHRTIISRTYFRQNGIDLLQTKNEMIKNILHIIKCISPAEMLGFCDICLPTIPFVHSKLECGRKFTFFVNVTPYASEWWCNSKIKRSRSRQGQGHWEQKWRNHTLRIWLPQNK